MFNFFPLKINFVTLGHDILLDSLSIMISSNTIDTLVLFVQL